MLTEMMHTADPTLLHAEIMHTASATLLHGKFGDFQSENSWKSSLDMQNYPLADRYQAYASASTTSNSN